MGVAGMGARFLPGEPEESIAALTKPLIPPFDFSGYRKCPTCGAGAGEVCQSMSGRVVGGQPDGVRTPLPRAHGHRRLRVGR